MASLTIENYIKTIYALNETSESGTVSTGSIADKLNVSPGTVTSMLKTLNESGLANYAPYEGVSLTDAGNALALRVIRRHRLIESFLVDTLKLNWDEVHDEAENLEHAVSDFLVDRMDQFLGHPETDPHGAPIPKRDGTMLRQQMLSLAEMKEGQMFRLGQVTDQSPDFLKFVTSTGLSIGKVGRLLSRNDEAGTVSIEIGGKKSTCSKEIAHKFQVVAVGDE